MTPPGQKEHHDNIANDIDGHIYANVGGATTPTTFFENKPWSSAAGQNIHAAKEHNLGLGQVLQLRDGLRTPALSQHSLVLSRPNSRSEDEIDLADVLFVAEFCPDGPLWPCCEAFDIAQDLDRFATIVVGFMLMSDVDLGVGDLIREDDQGKYILCRDDTAGLERLYLGEPTIFERTSKTVLKWSPAGEKSEAKMLELVKERNPWGVLQLLHHRAVCDIDGLHQGLVLVKPRELRPDATAGWPIGWPAG
ncbi:hypothetical protein CPLU01_04857 [Colletotrichum plurivorum]|uniref:Fungal-type protein kinase domain-containing protein n=1 Tax=Colletotrichum plurivorum TaxID=2175906 RepID=A0A8H6NI90_9PEZI|nr:hypothetical protein CPLU01_04857 [Colletotrichum plurivorum]